MVAVRVDDAVLRRWWFTADAQPIRIEHRTGNSANAHSTRRRAAGRGGTRSAGRFDLAGSAPGGRSTGRRFPVVGDPRCLLPSTASFRIAADSPDSHQAPSREASLFPLDADPPADQLRGQGYLVTSAGMARRRQNRSAPSIGPAAIVMWVIRARPCWSGNTPALIPRPETSTVGPRRSGHYGRLPKLGRRSTPPRRPCGAVLHPDGHRHDGPGKSCLAGDVVTGDGPCGRPGRARGPFPMETVYLWRITRPTRDDACKTVGFRFLRESPHPP